MPKCYFNKVAWHGCPPVNLLHIFRTPFSKKTSRGLLLKLCYNKNCYSEFTDTEKRNRVLQGYTDTSEQGYSTVAK